MGRNGSDVAMASSIYPSRLSRSSVHSSCRWRCSRCSSSYSIWSNGSKLLGQSSSYPPLGVVTRWAGSASRDPDRPPLVIHHSLSPVPLDLLVIHLPRLQLRHRRAFPPSRQVGEPSLPFPLARAGRRACAPIVPGLTVWRELSSRQGRQVGEDVPCSSSWSTWSGVGVRWKFRCGGKRGWGGAVGERVAIVVGVDVGIKVGFGGDVLCLRRGDGGRGRFGGSQ